MINLYKFFFGFSFFRFRVKKISYKKLKKENSKNKVIVIFFHPKINNEKIKEVFFKKWNAVFKKLNLDPVFLTKETFNKWLNDIKKENNENQKKSNIFNKYFVFISDKHNAMREYRTILLSASKTYFLKNQNKYLFDNKKSKESLFVNVYNIQKYELSY
ncbi:MAG: hypothetical protein K2H56_00685 [Malacoplasma sp.]|nr:hypothetical protein [Malacoplasma sp.]